MHRLEFAYALFIYDMNYGCILIIELVDYFEYKITG